jgi:hypothetical protein
MPTSKEIIPLNRSHIMVTVVSGKRPVQPL